MSVTDVEKSHVGLFEGSSSMGVTDAKKSRGPLFENRNDFGTCEHGNPLLGRCRECAIKRAEKRREHADRALAAQKNARCCGDCGRALSPTDPVFIRGLPVYSGRSQVPVCSGCAKMDVGYYNYLRGACEECGRSVTSEYLNRPRRKYNFCCDTCRTVYLNRLHSNRRKERNKRFRQKVCEVCGEEFTATRAHAKTCSKACKQKAYRRRKGDSGDDGGAA